MSYRSKRLRKKLRVGEFQHLCFLCVGELDSTIPMDSDNFIDRVIDFVESQSMCICDGPDNGWFKFYVDANHGKKLTTSDCENFRNFMLSMPEVKSAKYTEFRDAYYGNIYDWFQAKPSQLFQDLKT